MSEGAVSEDPAKGDDTDAADAEAYALSAADLEAVQGGTGDGPPDTDVPDNSRDANLYSSG